MGGEEFCVILPDTTQSVAYAWAEQLRIQLQNTPLAINSQSLAVTASFGVCGFAATPSQSITPDSLIKQVDELLYQAKKEGRNRVISKLLEGA